MYFNNIYSFLCSVGFGFYDTYDIVRGYAVAQLIEALRYKPEGRGFDSLSDH
jgi:hypothetical protein